MFLRFFLMLAWPLWVFSVSLALDAQSRTDDVFQHLNLDYPGLEKVKKAYEKGNLGEARKKLLEYYQNRTNRRLENTEKEYPCNIDEAERNIQNSFTLKSSTYDFGDKIDWTMVHQDNQWQFSLCRMNWFMNYIGVYQKTKDEKYIQAWMNQINSWIALEDPGYPRTLDTGRRLENWVISHWMFVSKLRSPSVTPEFNAKLLLSMAEQAEFLFQPDHWRRYSNWGSFENSGLAKLVILFPEFKRHDMWLREIYFRMRFQLSESFHSDGMHIEVSPSYHSHELQVWFDFVRLARVNGVTSPWHSQIPLKPLKELFLPPARALMYFYKPTGVVPQVGDTDERDERYFLFELGQYWKIPELTYVASDGRKGQPPEKSSVAFPDGGYYIMRSGWGENGLPFDEELYLLFDCGTNYPWHAHYDMLNIVVTAYGHDLLKDTGRFTYNQGEERDYFKSTAAHNTIVIDEFDQPKRYSPPRAEWHSLVGFDYVMGIQISHPQVTHQRSVFFAKPEYWIVVDRLEGSGTHRYDQFWHLSDKVLNKVEIEDGGKRVNAPHLQFLFPGKEGKVNIKKGYISYTYRQKSEAPVVRYSVEGKPPRVWPTVLYPYKMDVPELTAENLVVDCSHDSQDSSAPVAILISSPKRKDFFFEQEEGGVSCHFWKFESDAKMVFISTDNQDKIIGYQMVGGSFLNYLDEEVAHISGKRPDLSVQSDRVEIEGDCLHYFQLDVQGMPDVFLNGQKVDVERKKDKVSFSHEE